MGGVYVFINVFEYNHVECHGTCPPESSGAVARSRAGCVNLMD